MAKHQPVNQLYLTDTDICLDVTCPDEAEDKISQNMSLETSLTTSPCPNKTNKKCLDDDEETYEVVYNNLPTNLTVLKDCIHKAQGCCLLLILKFFLKEVYSISER